MADKIEVLKKALLSNLVRYYSWGVKDLHVSDRDITFTVNALKYKGEIKIFAKDNEYIALLIHNNAIFHSKNASSLINIIDNYIEKSETYQNDVIKWFENDFD